MNTEYEFTFIPDNEDLTKLSWRLDKNGQESAYDDFLPENTLIKINDIELSSNLESSVAEFIFDLSIENSVYTSMDTDLSGEESEWEEEEYNQIKNISVGTPTIYLSDYEDKYGNVFSDWAFTKSDQYPTINLNIDEDGVAGTIQNEFLIKMNFLPEDVSSNFKFSDSDDVWPSNSEERNLNYEVLDAGHTLKVTCDACSIDDKTMNLELIGIQLDFVSLDEDEFIKPVYFDLYTHSIDVDEVDASSYNSVRVGQPSISFDDTYQHEIFVLHDESGNLSEFTYKESDEVASAQGYIEIEIRPDQHGNSFKFSDLNKTAQYLGIEGDGAEKVLDITFPNNDDSSSTLILELSTPLEPGEEIRIGEFDSGGQGLHITDFLGEVEETFLYVEVNSFLDSNGEAIDAVMSGDDHIRIGNPSLNISENQVFLRSDSINPGCTELELSQIIIEEGNVPVIRSREGIKITLPPHLIWDPVFLPTLECYECPANLNFETRAFIDNTLSIDLESGSYLAEGDIITINGAHVIPVGTLTTPIDDDEEQHITLYVNDKKNAFDNDLALTNSNVGVNYLAVDDIEIYFEANSDQNNNNGDIAYVVDDGNDVNMSQITIESVTGNWPVLQDRNLRVILPQNIHFNTIGGNGWTNNGQNNNELEINSGANTTAINISGTIDLLICNHLQKFKYLQTLNL